LPEFLLPSILLLLFLITYFGIIFSGNFPLVFRGFSTSPVYWPTVLLAQDGNLCRQPDDSDMIFRVTGVSASVRSAFGSGSGSAPTKPALRQRLHRLPTLADTIYNGLKKERTGGTDVTGKEIRWEKGKFFLIDICFKPGNVILNT
jgi:hypothetical protein